MSSLAGRTILVVEDEALIALDLVKSIEEAGRTPLSPTPRKTGLPSYSLQKYRPPLLIISLAMTTARSFVSA